MSQLTGGLSRIREDLSGVPPPKARVATSPARKTQASSSRGQQPAQQAGTASEHQGGGAAAGGPKTVPALFDCQGPSSSDQVLPHPADPADLHYVQGPILVKASFACPPGLESSMLQGEKSTERRSVPPSRRSPGAQSRDTGHSLQFAQMMEMMRGMTHQLQEVKLQVAKLQQSRDPFPFGHVMSFNGEDMVDDRNNLWTKLPETATT